MPPAQLEVEILGLLPNLGLEHPFPLYPVKGLKAGHLSLWPEISSAEAALRELGVIGAQGFEGMRPAGGTYIIMPKLCAAGFLVQVGLEGLWCHVSEVCVFTAQLTCVICALVNSSQLSLAQVRVATLQNST